MMEAESNGFQRAIGGVIMIGNKKTFAADHLIQLKVSIFILIHYVKLGNPKNSQNPQKSLGISPNPQRSKSSQI